MLIRFKIYIDITEQQQSLDVAEVQTTTLKTEQNTNLQLVEGGTQLSSTTYTMQGDTGLFPFKNQVPQDIFQRQYMIYSNVLTPEIFGSEAPAVTLYPFRELFTKNPGNGVTTPYYDIIQRFGFFRSDIEIEVIIDAPITTYGFYVLTWYPFYDSTQPYPLFDGYDWRHFSSLHSAYGSVGDCESITMTLPFQYYSHCVSVYDGTFDSAMVNLGALSISYLDGDQIGSIDVASMGLRVMARPVNAILTGPVWVDPPIAQMLGRAGGSRRSPNEQLAHDFKTTATVLGAGIAGMSALYTAATRMYAETKGITPSSNTSVNEGNSRTGVKQSVYGDISSLTSSPSFQQLGDYSCDSAPSSVMVGEDQMVEQNIYALCRRWTAIKRGRIFQNGVVSEGEQIVSPVDMETGFAPFYSRFFRFWRGSMEYKFIFFAPALITLRVQILVYMQNQNSVATIARGDEVGDMITYNVTVRGTTEFCLTVPFMYKQAWLDCHDTDYMLIDVRIFPFVCSDSSCRVPFLLLGRTGEDFLFSGFKSGSCNAPIAQGLFNGPEEAVNLGDGSGKPLPCHQARASTGNIQTLLRRASVRSNGYLNGFYTPGDSIVDAQTWVEADIFDQIAVTYAFWTGSMNYKCRFAPDATVSIDDIVAATVTDPNETTPGIAFGDFRTGNGSQATNLGIWPVIEVNFPFYSRYAVSGTRRYLNATLDLDPPLPIQVSTVDTSPIPERVLVTPGPDFLFFVQWPPPPEDNLPVRTLN